MTLDSILSLQDFENRARRLMPAALFGFVQGGAEDGLSVRGNRQALEAIRLQPRVLRDTSARTTATSVWGETWAAPFGIAPMGAAALMARDADLVLARAAARANIPFALSGSSLTPMERVIEANPRAWFQLYPSADPAPNRVLLQRAQAAGYRTLVVTVDVAVGGRREDDIRNGYTSPLRPSARLMLGFASRPQWALRHLLPTLITRGMPHFENFSEGRAPMISRTASRGHRRDAFDWAHLQALRDLWPHRLVVKGILAPADAAQAWAMGADGVIVSNHGGRQLDGAIAPADALLAMPARGAGQALFCDGGIRRGNDIIKTLGRGASLAWIGRPMLYAAVVGGQAGVERAIALLQEEMLRSMALLGMQSPTEAHSVVL